MTRDKRIGWSDEFRIGLYGTTHRVLAPRGVKVRQRVQIVRDWYWLGLVVLPRTGELMWAWLLGTRAAHIAPAVQEWHDRGVDALVWDGLRAHTDRQVRATGMVVITQPASSPELNPAERIGEEIRDKVEGEVYETIWHKMAAVEAVLDGLRVAPERVRELTGWDWVLTSLRRLPLKPRKRWEKGTAR